MSQHHFNKLSAKYCGPYMVEQKVGSVAYKLNLPAELMLHPTFHVSLLKPCHKIPTHISHPPVLNLASPYCPRPHKVLERRLIQKGNKALAQWLIHWDRISEDQATWEDANTIKIRFLKNFIPRIDDLALPFTSMRLNR
ncbi:uncharacterized protein LOC142168891 [Nicotiana tabacum]|uniref:Uncharacterized protein LOC142168891 n=1 Tax=Nicotiana tabacum TaxID=4097 RepID=A0AC58SMG9_TOBAC